jgi:hypothetical protein
MFVWKLRVGYSKHFLRCFHVREGELRGIEVAFMSFLSLKSGGYKVASCWRACRLQSAMSD